MIQGSEEWLKARAGSLGASSLADAIARTKTGWGASRANLMARLVAERITGDPQETYINGAMQRGTEMEPRARAAYAFAQGIEVVEIGITPHPVIEHAHASPDGLVGHDGLVEIKCPNTSTHIETLLSGKIPDRYMIQMQWQMACAGRQWCDFVSFDDRMPAGLELFVKRVDRDDQRIAELEAMAAEFLDEVAQTVNKLLAIRD